MFTVSTLEDNVRVEPSDLQNPRAVQNVLEGAFLDTVIPELGLVITIFDILDVQGGFIYPGDGAAHFVVKFRLVVFRPFVDQVLRGTVNKLTK